jgi:hypothetical protein
MKSERVVRKGRCRKKRWFVEIAMARRSHRTRIGLCAMARGGLTQAQLANGEHL